MISDPQDSFQEYCQEVRGLLKWLLEDEYTPREWVNEKVESIDEEVIYDRYTAGSSARDAANTLAVWL